jgi:PKD repeat protein
VTFTSTSTDADGTIATLAWDFDNDGNFNDGAGNQAQYQFVLPGPHTVKLLAIDNNGVPNIATKTIQVANRPPVASFGFLPAAPKTGEQITSAPPRRIPTARSRATPGTRTATASSTTAPARRSRPASRPPATTL